MQIENEKKRKKWKRKKKSFPTSKVAMLCGLSPDFSNKKPLSRISDATNGLFTTLTSNACLNIFCNSNVT